MTEPKSAAEPAAKSEPPAPAPPQTPVEQQDLVTTATAEGNLKTLLELAQWAEVLDEVRGGGSYTILAPTDEAFAKVPADKLQALKEDKGLLRQVLLHHAIADVKLTAQQLVDRQRVMPFVQPDLEITRDDGTVSIGGAHIIKADIDCSDGMLHVIDKVLIPEPVSPPPEERAKE